MPPAPRVAQKAQPRDIRMTLLYDLFIPDLKPYRYKAGTVVKVDQETADRWLENHIAVNAAETDKTYAEQKKAELARLQAQIRDLEAGEAEGDMGLPVPPEHMVARDR